MRETQQPSLLAHVWAAAAVLLWCAAPPSMAAPAATGTPAPGPSARLPPSLHLEGKRLVWQGELTRAHAAQFAQLLKQHQVDGLELRNSPGASQFASAIYRDVYNLIQKHRLRTWARGICASLCASIFLSGREPTLLASTTAGVPTLLLYHAIRNNGVVDVDETRIRADDIAAVRGEPARRLLLKLADARLPLAAALYVFPKPVKANAGASAILFCSGQPGQRIEQCEPVPGDPLRDLGVINGL